MTVWVFLIRMPDDDIRRVCYAHLLHIFMRNFKHEIISHSVAVFREKPSEMCPQGSLILDLVSVGLSTSVTAIFLQPSSPTFSLTPSLSMMCHTRFSDGLPVLFHAGKVIQTIAKRIAVTYFANHISGLFSLNRLIAASNFGLEPTPHLPRSSIVRITSSGNLVEIVSFANKLVESGHLFTGNTLDDCCIQYAVASECGEAGITGFPHSFSHGSEVVAGELNTPYYIADIQDVRLIVSR